MNECVLAQKVWNDFDNQIMLEEVMELLFLVDQSPDTLIWRAMASISGSYTGLRFALCLRSIAFLRVSTCSGLNAFFTNPYPNFLKSVRT
jgi:hypothetical protein